LNWKRGTICFEAPTTRRAPVCPHGGSWFTGGS